MADVVLTREQIVVTGMDPVDNSIDATDVYFVDNQPGQVFLHFKNTGGTVSVVTFDTTQQIGGLDIEDPTVNIPATTGDVMIGPFPTTYEVKGGSDDGRIKFSQDQATGVTVAVLRL